MLIAIYCFGHQFHLSLISDDGLASTLDRDAMYN